MKNRIRQMNRMDQMTDVDFDAVLAVNLKLSVPDCVRVSEDLIQKTLRTVKSGQDAVKVNGSVRGREWTNGQDTNEQGRENGLKRAANRILCYRKPLAAAAAVLCLAFVGTSVFLGGMGVRNKEDMSKNELVQDAPNAGIMTSPTMAMTTMATTIQATEVMTEDSSLATDEKSLFAQGGSGAECALVLREAGLVTVSKGTDGERIELAKKQAEELAVAFAGTGQWGDWEASKHSDEALWNIRILDTEKEWEMRYVFYSDGSLLEEISRLDAQAIGGATWTKRYVPEKAVELDELIESFLP